MDRAYEIQGKKRLLQNPPPEELVSRRTVLFERKKDFKADSVNVGKKSLITTVKML